MFIIMNGNMYDNRLKILNDKIIVSQVKEYFNICIVNLNSSIKSIWSM